MNKVNLETKLIGNIKGNFIVPAYQRGYRWKEEVKMLLDDINEIPDKAKYCLQPIVVKRLQDDKYELIDGQQRLTTLFLLFKYISSLNFPCTTNYSIEYAIRTNSKTILSAISVKNSDTAKDIDEFFMQEAYNIINIWFNNQSDSFLAAINLYKKLSESIYVIWYEIDESEDAISLFTRLNIGKIPLTNAELVKAIFLSKNNGIDERYQLEISTQWDNIEKELHDDKFWYFITNQKAEKYPTRIELLFDIMANKQKSDRERYRTFFKFVEKTKEEEYKDNKIALWKEVVETFQRLKEWYNNSELYHKIGYLIAVNQSTLNDLLKESSEKGKDEFKQSLNTLIANSIDYNKAYLDLSYDNKSDHPNIERLLLLFNVESVFQNGDKSMRFPFDRHKNQDGGWSLEHIHAQQSEGLDKREQWNEWLDLHVQSLKNIDAKKNESLIDEIEKRDKTNLIEDRFNELFEKVINALNLESNIEYIHTLANMALLSKNDNSALNNSTFDVKRDKILEMDKKGEYIPICTRRVFLKYYTHSGENQLHFWGQPDRDAYLQAMNGMLKPYLLIINKQI